MALVGISLRSATPNFSVVRKMLGIGHFDLKRTYSKDAPPGRTTQEFGVFCCLLTVLRTIVMGLHRLRGTVDTVSAHHQITGAACQRGTAELA